MKVVYKLQGCVTSVKHNAIAHTQKEKYRFSTQTGFSTQVSGHVTSIERDRNSRYFSQVSIFFNEASVSMISSIWYRYRPTLISQLKTTQSTELTS